MMGQHKNTSRSISSWHKIYIFICMLNNASGITGQSGILPLLTTMK